MCRPSCDPLTQRRPDGSACAAGEGCYLLAGDLTSIAVCAAAGTIGHDEPIAGLAFANSCLPGLEPRRADQTGTAMECGALCDVEDVFVTDPADADSGPRPAPRPAAEVTNADAEGGRAPITCASKGAAPPDDPAAGESCRYWWARETFDELSPYSNTIGWCFEHTSYRYDSDGDQAVDAPFPRCAALSSADKVPPLASPPHDDARYFWCKALPAMLKTSVRRVRTFAGDAPLALDRVARRR